MPIMVKTYENQIRFLAEMAANDGFEGAFIKKSFCSPHPSYKHWDLTLLRTTCWVNNSNWYHHGRDKLFSVANVSRLLVLSESLMLRAALKLT